MNLREYYIEKYRIQKKELTEKNELWRICVDTEKEFIEKLDDILIDSLVFDYINDFHRENSVKGQIHILLQTKKNDKEWKEEIKRRQKETEKADKEAIPIVKELLKTITTPLDWVDIVKISKWIWRKQITFNELNPDIQKEFKKTNHYNHLRTNNKL